MPTPPAKEKAPDRHGVDERQSWIQEDEDLHLLARSLRIGTREMRRLARSGTFMKPNPGELEIVVLGDETSYTVEIEGVGPQAVSRRGPGGFGTYTSYDLRVERSAAPNPWARSIRATSRLPFRSRIQLDGWETELAGVERLDDKGKLVEKKKGWVDDIDGEGRTLDQWAAEAMEDALFEGIVYGFVDNDPRTFPDPQSRRLAGARPYVAKIKRCDVKRISIEMVQGGTPRLKQFVFAQPVNVQDFSDPDAWVDEAIPALKVVTAGEKILDPETGREIGTLPITTRVYVEDERGTYIHDPDRDGEIVPEGGKSLTEIPLVPFYGKRVGPWRGHSPYMGDSAEMQVALWNHCSELLNKARETALSYLFESGIPEGNRRGSEPIDASKQSLRFRGSTNPQADLKFVEQSGGSLKSLRELVEWLSAQIEHEHHAINSEKPSQPVTAREITLEGVHATSFLEMVTLFHEHGWQRLLELMATLGGHRTIGTCWISKNFGLPNVAMERNSRMCLGGQMTRGNYWTVAMAAGEVNAEDGFDLQAEIDAEAAEGEGLRELMKNLDPVAPGGAGSEDEDEEEGEDSESDGNPGDRDDEEEAGAEADA